MQIQFTPKDITRFWSRVTKTETCWLWTGSLTEKGYGKFSVGTKNMRAHRVAWMIAWGEIPDDMNVCHTCDNPACVNPAHFFLGTTIDNNKDRDAKGRLAILRGERASGAKLRDEDIPVIRQKAAEGIDPFTISLDYGISHKTIRRIVNRTMWEHIA